MKKEKIYAVGLALLIALTAFLGSFFDVFYAFDKMISDPLYHRPSVTDPTIRLVAIDEKTIAEYGDVSTWDRSLWADLISVLNAGEIPPAVIGLDMLFVGNNTQAGDDAFAEACAKYKNVITAVNLVYATKVDRTEQGMLAIDSSHIEMVEYPFAQLKAQVGYGFANTIQDDYDSYIREAISSVSYEGETIDSLAVALYKAYCEKTGLNCTLPKTFGNNRFTFTYSGKSGAYETVSMVDVLNGTVNIRAFAGSIVLVGAYAPGMQDAYDVPVQRGAQMYGVEIHANILEAILEGKTGVQGNSVVYALVVAVVSVLFYVACRKWKVLPTAILLAVCIGLDLLAGVLLHANGIVVPAVELPIYLVVIYAVHLGRSYFSERLRRKQVVSVFKKYVAPQVVDEVCKQKDVQLVLGGESREIAVLFVDIRGFTPMSEKLEPEQVVEILNEYLALTTNSIFKNGGTLDKFIGDATMAVFNAPFDLDDYIYRAVCTARDIAAGSAELEKKLQERFGRSVSFGIGVNCGKAVVGNIGCEFRMDYTAIGDTVNTAARLESNAKPGQILISSDVYEALKDRLEVTEIGVIPLKGKSNGICVYQVDKVL